MDAKKIDEAIDALCERVIAEAKGDAFGAYMPYTITALAKLIEARAAIVAIDS